MEKEGFDTLDVGEVISSFGCEDTALTALTARGEMHSDETSDVNPDNTLETVLANSNETVSHRELGKLPESENDVGTPFLFVGVKMEMPDDYESEVSCENLESQYSSEEYSTNHEKENEEVDECLEGSSPMLLNSTSYVQVKMECEDNIESEFDFQVNDDMSMTTDTNCTFESRSEDQGCDVEHSNEKFIKGIECLDYPILQVKEEGEHAGNQIAVNRKNSAFGRNLGALNHEEEKEMNKTLDEAETLQLKECATELNPDNNPLKGKNLSCNVPRPILDEDESLQLLTQSDKSKNPLSCFKCKKFFREASDLEKHFCTHSAVKSYSCQVCNASFAFKNDVKRHMRTHTGEKPFTCDICQKSFSLNERLKVHMRVHTGEKPFSCNICQKSFQQNSGLKTHVRTHTSEKPYSCIICKKKFTRKDTRDDHMRVHTGEKPFSCHVCEKSFSLKKNLKSHILTHTGEKPFSCHECESTFAHKSTLNRHMRTHMTDKAISLDMVYCSDFIISI